MDFFTASADDLERLGWGRWGPALWLCPKAQFDALPDGIALRSISGRVAVKGRDYIDDETRFGMLAYGIVPGQTTTTATAAEVATAQAVLAAETRATIAQAVHAHGVYDLNSGKFVTGDEAVALISQGHPTASD